jgi:hypothetical protein
MQTQHIAAQGSWHMQCRTHVFDHARIEGDAYQHMHVDRSCTGAAPNSDNSSESHRVKPFAKMTDLYISGVCVRVVSDCHVLLELVLEDVSSCILH